MKKIIGFALVTILLVTNSMTHADLLAYWRFGDDPNGFLADSSGNNLTLSQGTANDAVQVTLPATGPGSNFSNPVPQTDAANANALQVERGTDSSYLRIADPFSGGLSNFTVEAYFNVESLTSTQTIVGQYGTTGNQRSWGIMILNNTGVLRLNLSNNGSSVGQRDFTGLTVQAGRDYYMAFSYDSTTGTDNVILRLQDLTGNGDLLTGTLSYGGSNPLLHNSTADLEIGAYNSGDNSFGGLIDEVRISSGVLPTSELLIIPEPSTFLLSLLGLASVLVVMRRGR